MDRRIKRLFALLALLPLVAACMPESPETELSWRANDRLSAASRTAAAAVCRAATPPRPMSPGDDPRRPKPRRVPPMPRRPSQRVLPARRELPEPSHSPAAFAWPVSGNVISNFGGPANGERNDGINISTPMGTPIHAAASGTVSYSGNELKDYGNLVLIKHEEGYVTAYAHADRLLVSRGDFVVKGQVIGYAGQTGDVTTPQLHFEIRHDTTPLNPRNLCWWRATLKR